MPCPLLTLLLGALPMTTSLAQTPLYAPPGMVTNDNWFAKSGDTYHAFYLCVPKCMGDVNDWSQRGKFTEIGHATSKDLVHWTDQGPVVVPIPGTWHSQLATGSVAQFGGKWWMIYTSAGTPPGLALAVSDDLMTWKLVGDKPVVPFQAFDAEWQGKPIKWVPMADPYLYPEPIDGWMVMVINSRVEGAPENSHGCLPTLRSKDMLNWEPGPVLAYPEWVERPETPQLWRHGDKWYLYYGAAHDQPEFAPKWLAEAPEGIRDHRRVNCVMVADRFEGPYRHVPGKWWLDRMPDGRGGYIHKVLTGPDGNDVLITTTDGYLSPPYRVVYGDDGSVGLE